MCANWPVFPPVGVSVVESDDVPGRVGPVDPPDGVVVGEDVAGAPVWTVVGGLVDDAVLGDGGTPTTDEFGHNK